MSLECSSWCHPRHGTTASVLRIRQSGTFSCPTSTHWSGSAALRAAARISASSHRLRICNDGINCVHLMPDTCSAKAITTQDFRQVMKMKTNEGKIFCFVPQHTRLSSCYYYILVKQPKQNDALQQVKSVYREKNRNKDMLRCFASYVGLSREEIIINQSNQFSTVQRMIG